MTEIKHGLSIEEALKFLNADSDDQNSLYPSGAMISKLTEYLTNQSYSYMTALGPVDINYKIFPQNKSKNPTEFALMYQLNIEDIEDSKLKVSGITETAEILRLNIFNKYPEIFNKYPEIIEELISNINTRYKFNFKIPTSHSRYEPINSQIFKVEIIPALRSFEHSAISAKLITDSFCHGADSYPYLKNMRGSEAPLSQLEFKKYEQRKSNGLEAAKSDLKAVIESVTAKLVEDINTSAEVCAYIKKFIASKQH